MALQRTRTVLGVIPARYGSTRFPGKPLALLHGKPLIQHVYERARSSKLLSRLLVATDHEDIARAVFKCGGEVVMTPSEIATGTERVAYVARDQSADVVVNIQGDEPTLQGALLDDVIRPLLVDPELPVATPVCIVSSWQELSSQNYVRVVRDSEGYALYFSRAIIPYLRDVADREQWLQHHTFYKHIGIYAFQKEFLLNFVTLAPSALEQAESLEQLRILENGFRIKTIVTAYNSHTVETPEDLALLTSSSAVHAANGDDHLS